jgi:ABC-2 type transport system ATP-binding protein
MGKLECHGLTKIYEGKSTALDNINLSVETKGIFGLIGRNGAGKTTLIRILATELEQTKGTAAINGFDIIKQTAKLREKIAIVPQEARTVRWMTPKQTVFSYLLWRGYSVKDAHRLAAESLAKLGLTQYQDMLNTRLSGGTKRKVLIATVTASEAEIIFLDEPTTGLDPISRRELWAILRELGKTRFIFLTTHYLEEAEQLADQIGVLKEGKLVALGTLQDLRKSSPYQYSIKLPPNTALPQLIDSQVTESPNGMQVMTNEKEAFTLAKTLADQGIKFSITPITLDDIFFQLVGEKAEDTQ